MGPSPRSGTPAHQARGYNDPHFTAEETGSQKSNLTQAMPRGSGRQDQASQLYLPHVAPLQDTLINRH